MAKKQVIDENIALVKKAIEDSKIIIGTDETVKELKKGNLVKIFLSSNCPEDVKTSIEEYAELTGTEVVQLAYPNDEFAVLCKKPFPISLVGIMKE